MKQCSKCKEWKPKSEFDKAPKGKDGLYAACKECRHNQYLANADKVKQERKLYYKEHQSEILKYAKDARIRNKEKRQDFITDIKTNCVKCGEHRKYVIDFHHINPNEKKLNVSNCKIVSNALIGEISKCVCLCRNCHFEFHYFYGNNPKHPVESLTEYLGKNPYDVVPKIIESNGKKTRVYEDE